jgi:TPR repeat protein
MRKYLFCLAMVVCGSAMADELADANKLLEAKSYPQAMAILIRLAGAGNANAQLRLGQVYWYGEGVAVDRAKGDALYARAVAAGSEDAKIALGLTAARQQHLADIEYWTAKYDGADLTSGKYHCEAPPVPAKSTTNDEIKSTWDAINAWKACYNGFAQHLDDAWPAGRRIPVRVADLMTDDEINQAKAHLADVYTRVAGDEKANADKTLAAFDNWTKETEMFVAEQNLASQIDVKQLERGLAIRSSNATRFVPVIPHPVAPTGILNNKK